MPYPCPTCRLIRVRDVSREYTRKEFREALYPGDSGSIADPTYNSDSEFFNLPSGRYPVLSYEATSNFFHGACHGELDEPIKLCTLCGHWFKLLLFGEWRKDEPIAEICLGTLTEMEAREDCSSCRALCQIIIETTFRPESNKVLSLELKKLETETSKLIGQGRIVYGGHDTTNIVFERNTSADVFPELQFFEKDGLPPMLIQQEVNWERLLHWFDTSSKYLETGIVEHSYIDGIFHGFDTSSKYVENGIVKYSHIDEHESNSSEEALPHGFCLVDIAESCLVPINGTDAPRYAALSYVWDKSDNGLTTTMDNFTQVQIPGRLLKSDVPQLFQDAFKVCLQLGVKYFWIDRICIVQDDPVIKPIQIEAMGQIYSKAEFTILSTEPSLIRDGLYGLSQSRSPQLGIPIGPMMLAHCDKHIGLGFWGSTWTTRGWTYQEGILSRRILVFGKDRVRMFCRGRELSDFDGPFGENSTPGPEGLHYPRPDFCCISMDDKGYAKRVEEYSTRQLTYDSDVLNAFMGALSKFGQQMYGIPLSMFDQAMLWYHCDGHCNPRSPTAEQEMPSWSWISTLGGVKYHYVPYRWLPLYSIATWANVVFNSPSDDYVVEPLDVYRPFKDLGKAERTKVMKDLLLPLETQAGYDPIIIAGVAHICDQYRQVEEKLGTERDPKRLWALGEMKKQFSENWPSECSFESFDAFIRQIPRDERLEVLLRVGKPSLPDLKMHLPRPKLEAASFPGRIIVHCPKLTVVLRYKAEIWGGIHIYQIEHDNRILGIAELTDVNHQELLTSKYQVTGQETMEVHCIALSMAGMRVNYGRHRRGFRSSGGDPTLMVFVMIIAESSNGCSHRLGIGNIQFLEWGSSKVKIETTILE